MKKLLVVCAFGLLALTGCKSDEPTAQITAALPPPPPADEQIVATVRGESIRMKDLQPVLLDGYGLNVLLLLIQRDLVHDEAGRLNIVVTSKDIADERPLTIAALKKAARRVNELGGPSTQPDDDISPQEADQLLQQVLNQQHMSMAEFNIVMEVNAYLRKIAEPQVQAEMTEDAVHKQFNVMYGEKADVSYIVLNNMAEAAEVRRELALGRSFGDVARKHSMDNLSAPSGGELPPFTLMDNRFPSDFRQVAFLLKKGEVSDPIQIKNFIYIIKLNDRIPPAHAKFEDYRQFVRKELYDQAVSAAMTVMRNKLGNMARESMSIKEPLLRQQWEARVASQPGELHNMDEIRRQMDKEHLPPATAPTEPAASATRPATAQ